MNSCPAPYLHACDQSGWSPQELSELKHIVTQLTHSGYNIEAGWGISDEGDPWFVFMDDTNNMPLLHITRLNSIYTAIAPTRPGSFHSCDLKNLLLETIQHLITPPIRVTPKNIQ